MAASASATAASAASQKSDAKKRRRRRRLATSVQVTLLGFVLTAWLFPAITRQWDDRRKVRELKTTLVTEMSGATAQALAAAKGSLFETAYLERRRDLTINTGPVPSAVMDWSIKSTRIDSQLRAYSSQRVLNDWRAYSHLMGDVLDVINAETFVVGTPSIGAKIEQTPSYRAAGKTLAALDLEQLQFLKDQRKPKANHYDDAQQVEQSYNRLAQQLLRVQANVADEVLAGHISGYSTSTRDLLRGLLP
jgi:hypothetical protein